MDKAYCQHFIFTTVWPRGFKFGTKVTSRLNWIYETSGLESCLSQNNFVWLRYLQDLLIWILEIYYVVYSWGVSEPDRLKRKL